MKWRSHGANPEKLYEQFNIELPKEIIDFSTNTNVIDMDYSIDLKDIISNYPCDESRELKSVISKKMNIESDQILVTNGSNEAIYMIASLYNNASILQPTYSEYERALIAANKEFSYIKSIHDEIDSELLIICNPNNPTGTYIEKEELEKLALICKKNNTDILIDEAYVDFLENHKIIDINNYDNVYILRSLTKTYHLSGIRLGFVISSKDKILNLKRKQPTWSVNGLAQKLGVDSLENSEFLKKTIDYYSKETKRVVNALKELGYHILPSRVHYFLLEINNDEDLIRYLLKKGVIVRHTRNFPYLDGKYVRICVREKHQNDILISLLREYRNENTSS